MAVAIGEKIVALDVFDKPSTCQKVWDRMLSGVVFDRWKPVTANNIHPSPRSRATSADCW